MSCGGMGGCGGSSSGKSSNHSTKKTPNWGMTTNPMKKSSNSTTRGSGGFGTPKVRMSFRGSKRN